MLLDKKIDRIIKENPPSVGSMLVNGVNIFVSKRLREFKGSYKVRYWTFGIFNEMAMRIYDSYISVK